MHLSDLKHLPVTELVDLANSDKIENAGRMRKQDLIFAILKNKATNGDKLIGDGTLEVLQDGFGFLRSSDSSYLAGPADIYVSPSQIRRFNLHTGDTIAGEIRTPKDSERYFALVKVDKVNNDAPENTKNKILFENLTPIHPTKPLVLERDSNVEENNTSRVIDMVAPIGVLLAEETRRRDTGRTDHAIPFRPDHGHEILADIGRDLVPGYPLIGRLRGLAELRGIASALATAPPKNI